MSTQTETTGSDSGGERCCAARAAGVARDAIFFLTTRTDWRLRRGRCCGLLAPRRLCALTRFFAEKAARAAVDAQLCVLCVVE